VICAMTWINFIYIYIYKILIIKSVRFICKIIFKSFGSDCNVYLRVIFIILIIISIVLFIIQIIIF
jgi:hypothetical protein